MIKPVKGLSLVCLSGATIVIQPASAGDWYLVGNIGEATYQDVAGPQVEEDDTDTTWRLGGGYQINPHFAVEMAYVDAGKAEVRFSGPIPGVTFDPVPLVQDTVMYQASGVEISGLGQYPITEKLHVLGRLGVVYLEQETTRRTAYGIIDEAGQNPGELHYVQAPALDNEQSDFRPLVGAGVQYQVFESLAVRLEWMRYLDAVDLGNSEEDIDSLSLGVRYSF